MTSRAMAVLYIIGVGAVGAVLLVKIFSIAMPRAQYGLFEFGLLVVSHPIFWFHFHKFGVVISDPIVILFCCRLSCPLFFSCAFLASWPSYGGPTTITRDGFTLRRSTTLLIPLFLQLGALSISIASIIATVLAFEFVALINAHGDGSNVSARYGDKFLGMTWASAGLLLVGSFGSFMNGFVRSGGAHAPHESAPSKDEEES